MNSVNTKEEQFQTRTLPAIAWTLIFGSWAVGTANAPTIQSGCY